MRALVRGSLLHDFFLYDWHIPEKGRKLHAWNHASVAYENAKKEFELGKIEKDIILKHMFPINISLPKYRESLIVSVADKILTVAFPHPTGIKMLMKGHSSFHKI